MMDAFGGILRFLGGVLNAIYEVIPSYGVAIILLTILVRIVLFPLAVKQIKSMTAMQRIQPQLRELQKRHKGDRQKLNEEMMKLYREHGVNPFGGCFPMLLQLPVFIALYAVIRSGVPFAVALPAEQPMTLTIPVTKSTNCRAEPAGEVRTTVSMLCRTDKREQRVDVSIQSAVISNGSQRGTSFDGLPGYATVCQIAEQSKSGGETTVTRLNCQSPLGTGHLPKDGALFEDVVEDKASFLGMHLACSPTQASSKEKIRDCTAAAGAGAGAALIGYYLLVALMAGTTWYQQKQMLSRQSKDSPQAQQMALMAKIMPVFMGFLSLNFPAALSLYWVVGNFWMIGQQHFILASQGEPPVNGATPKNVRPAKGTPKPSAGGGKPAAKQSGKPGAQGRPGAAGRQGKRRKRR